MKIGIFYNFIFSALPENRNLQNISENEILTTVNTIKTILDPYHTVIPIQITRQNIDLIAQSQFDLIINLCEGIEKDAQAEPYIPALLDLLQIPYTGSDHFTLALCQNKAILKDLLTAHHIPTPPYTIISLDNEKYYDVKNIRLKKYNKSSSLHYPLIVKPIHEDASIGITLQSVVNNEKELSTQISLIHSKYAQAALVEEYIEGREINVAIWGNAPKHKCLPISEIIFEFEEGMPRIIDYNCKWVEDSYTFKHTKGVCPADLEKDLEKRLIDLSKMIFQLTGCRDYARVDFRIREYEIFVIEVNPNPCFSEDSGFFRSASESGFNYPQMIDRILQHTLSRYRIPHQKNLLEKFINTPIYNTANLEFYPITMDHIHYLEKWFNDPEIGQFMAEPESLESFENLIIKFLIHEGEFNINNNNHSIKNPLDEKNHNTLYPSLINSSSLTNDATKNQSYCNPFPHYANLDVRIIDKNPFRYFNERISLIIEKKPEKMPIGYCSIYNIATWNQNAEISFLIGENIFRGKGLAKEIVQSLVDIAFNYLNLFRLEAVVSENNLPSRLALEKLGFKQIGIRHNSHLLKGLRSNDVLYEILKET